MNAAEGRRDRQLALASSGADAFRYQLAAREPARSLTDFRLYWETISEAFAGRPKMILDARADRPQRLIMTRLPMEQGIPGIVGSAIADHPDRSAIADPTKHEMSQRAKGGPQPCGPCQAEEKLR